jgi:hypothetical protein
MIMGTSYGGDFTEFMHPAHPMLYEKDMNVPTLLLNDT